MPHLVFDISAHGFGHLAQATPVINELRDALPGIQITLRTAIAPDIVRDFLGEKMAIVPPPPAAVLVMDGPSRVDGPASFEAYSALHADWVERVENEARNLAALQPDLLVSDVDYLGLAAAQRIGIPNLAMSSLNWADIAEPYIDTMVGAGEILGQMREAYAGVEAFIRFAPGLSMDWLPALKSVGPVARIGRRQAELKQRLSLAADSRLGLVSFGGISANGAELSLARLEGYHWIVGGDLMPNRVDMTAAQDLDLSFVDILASVDFVLTKPGYGTFAEAACNGIPILHTIRADWPEYQPFCDWLEIGARSKAISEADLTGPALAAAIVALLGKQSPLIPNASGGQEAAEIISGYL